MLSADFREFLDALRSHGELVDIDRPIDLYVDVARALKRGNMIDGPPMNFRQNGTASPPIGGVYSIRAKALLAFKPPKTRSSRRYRTVSITRSRPRSLHIPRRCTTSCSRATTSTSRASRFRPKARRTAARTLHRHRSIERPADRCPRRRPLPLHADRPQHTLVLRPTLSPVRQEHHQVGRAHHGDYPSP